MKNRIFSGRWGKCHCQGFAIDTAGKYAYYSFTTKLVKTDTDGRIIGSVDHIIGHLGCIDFNDADGKLYASLEYKNDSIGRGILKSIGVSAENLEDGFYIAIFDVDKIDRLDMNAERDGVMRVVYLPTVVRDYSGTVEHLGKTLAHIHGCSGIDGLTIGPAFGKEKGSHPYLYVCYGIYSDLERRDNDYQVILQYDPTQWWETIAAPLSQFEMHHIGPEKPRNRYYLYTGNTTYGVQNLEYDAATGDFFAAVYAGKKPEFPNYSMFCIDGASEPVKRSLLGCLGEEGEVLSLKPIGECQNGIYGSRFPLGSMGMYSLGDGSFYFVDPLWDNREDLAVYAVKHRLVIRDGEFTFEKSED